LTGGTSKLLDSASYQETKAGNSAIFSPGHYENLDSWVLPPTKMMRIHRVRSEHLHIDVGKHLDDSDTAPGLSCPNLDFERHQPFPEVKGVCSTSSSNAFKLQARSLSSLQNSHVAPFPFLLNKHLVNLTSI
jgi:hypothetical protein